MLLIVINFHTLSRWKLRKIGLKNCVLDLAIRAHPILNVATSWQIMPEAMLNNAACP